MCLITSAFRDVAEEAARKKGLPGLPICFLPHPIFDRSVTECRNIIEGKSSGSTGPVPEKILDSLVTPPENWVGRHTPDGERERYIGPDTEENLQRLFHESGFTDGLPIVLPTEERVEKMLKGTSRKPEEKVGVMKPNPDQQEWEYTVEQVAINAVMAGADPEYLPVILAVASTGVSSLFTSTTSWARMLLVNGPIRQEIGMNSAIGAMGPFNRANATIGRAWTLISKNLGNSGRPGIIYMGSQGNNLNYNNVTIAENEEELPPGWEPFHVQKGFKKDQSVISIFSGIYFKSVMEPTHPIHKWPYTSPMQMASALRGLRSIGPYLNYCACVLVEPLLAKDLREIYGFDSKESLIQWLKANVFLENWEFFRIFPSKLTKALEGTEPYASWLKMPEGATVPIRKFDLPEPPEVPYRVHKDPISLIVLGGKTNHWYFVGDFYYVTSALVDEWR